MPAKYFLVFPKKTIDNDKKINKDHKSCLNDQNPMYRQRKKMKKNNSANNNSLEQNFIHPSTYLPNIIFKNTISHPFLIFYDLNRKFDEIPDGERYIQKNNSNTSLISQLSNFFGVDNILSIAKLKVDPSQVSDTWNKRFPNAKSNLFTPVVEGLKVTDTSDLQSLHLLGFSLNISIYLMFYVAEKYLYNMKLGPDNSDNDIHFKTYLNIDKSSIEFHSRDQIIIEYKKEKWLTFEIVDICKTFQKGPIKKPNHKILFLEMEKRDPIPIIEILEDESKKFTDIVLKIEKSSEQNSDISPNIEKNNSFKMFTDKNILEIVTNDKEIYKLKKIISIATSKSNSNESKDTDQNTISEKGNKFTNDTILAETNESAFFVVKSDSNSKNTDSNNALDEFGLCFGQQLTETVINETIISFRDRIKIPYKYSDLIIDKNTDKFHPLVNLLCLHYLTDIMLTSSEIIDAQIKRSQEDDRMIRLRIVPIENDSVFFTFEKFLQISVNTKKELKNKIKENWRRITQRYPAYLAIGQIHTYDDKYKFDRNEVDHDPIFLDFFYYVKEMFGHLATEMINLTRRTQFEIEQFMSSKVGLNPIFCPVIYKEYMELSKSNCIAYSSGKLYQDPLNDLLLRDARSVKDVTSRTTVKLFEESEVLKNSENGTFPVKIQTLQSKIKMKGNEIIPEPSFKFKSFELNRKIEKINESQFKQNPIKIHQFIENSMHKYDYEFYGIDNGEIIKCSKFTIKSQYELLFLYVSNDNIYAVANVSESAFAYGFCKTLDTEILFENFHAGIFQSAIYMENDSCLVISYKKKSGDKKVYFTGYDQEGQINESFFKNIEIKSLAVISRTFFGAKIERLKEKSQDYYVFKFNKQQRIVENKEYIEEWRIKQNPLCMTLLDQKAEDSRCFIGSQSLPSKGESTLVIYKYDEDKKLFTKNRDLNNDKKNSIPILNFKLGTNEDIFRNEEEDDDYRLIEKRLKIYQESKASNNAEEEEGEDEEEEEEEEEEEKKSNKNKNDKNDKDSTVIDSMLNCIPIQKDAEFSIFNFNCSLCELFPTPIVIKGRLVCYTDDSSSSPSSLCFYRCDHSIYRSISQQICGFYTNTYQKMTLFTTETLLNQYKFKKIKVTLIVDTCAIGARFSNVLFGTRFDEKDVLEDEIWCGFSYYNDVARIILLLHLNNKVENVFHSVQTIKKKSNDSCTVAVSPEIFVCRNDGVKTIVKLSNDPKIILTAASSNAGNIKKQISFVNKAEFLQQIQEMHKFVDDEDDNRADCFRDPKLSIDFAKRIITQYLSFDVFENYPHQTIEKYSDNSINNFNFKDSI